MLEGGGDRGVDCLYKRPRMRKRVGGSRWRLQIHWACSWSRKDTVGGQTDTVVVFLVPNFAWYHIDGCPSNTLWGSDDTLGLFRLSWVID